MNKLLAIACSSILVALVTANGGILADGGKGKAPIGVTVADWGKGKAPVGKGKAPPPPIVTKG